MDGFLLRDLYSGVGELFLLAYEWRRGPKRGFVLGTGSVLRD